MTENKRKAIAISPVVEEHRARARRRLLRLAVWTPPTLLTLSSLSGHLFGMAPKPSANPSAVPVVVPK